MQRPHLMDAVDQVRMDQACEKGREDGTVLRSTGYISFNNPWSLSEFQKTKLSDLGKLKLETEAKFVEISQSYLVAAEHWRQVFKEVT